MARSTRSSTMSRPRSCDSTMARRRPAWSSSGGMREGSAISRRLDAEVLERKGREVDDAPRRGGGKTDGEQRHLRVGGGKGAVAAAAEMRASREVGELDAVCGRDEQLAGVQIVQCGPGPFERVGRGQE